LGILSYNLILYNNLNYIKKKFFKGLLYNISNDILLNKYLDNFRFIIYQGFIRNNSNLYKRANVILPNAAPYEMDGLFINLEGRYRFMKKNIKNFVAIYTD
jgi:NADH dehydrogenase/NADH:ubiquinone oxidoreductase subunit G